MEKAIADYSEAIRIKPDRHSYLVRGNAYTRVGKYDKAITDFSEVIRIKPDYAGAYWNRGFANLGKGHKAKAEADFAKAKELGYKPEQ